MRSHTLFWVFLFAAAGASVSSPAQQQDAIPQPATQRVTQFVDGTHRTSLPGNLHPLARREFDQGEAPPDLLLGRMLMVLKRGPEQEAALARLLENQQDIQSPAYHQWLTP